MIGQQEVEGNITLFTNRTKTTEPWSRNFISDGEKLFGKNQPHLVMPGDTTW
ncbi:MAG: hypothetical protein JWP97_968 [Labilithrix sp.]|nr:hypothetical protein [Labilithrix sp.]